MGEPDQRHKAAGDRLYDLSARSWDEKFRSGDHYATDRPFEGLFAVVEELRKARLGLILDIGCGDGRNIPLLSQLAPRIVGLDRAESGLLRLREKPTDPRCSVFVAKGDIARLPFGDAVADAAVNVWVMNHGTDADIRAYIAEMRRVLRPGGLLFASVSAWSFPIAVGMAVFGRRIGDSSLDGHTYLIRFRSEEGVHHFFTRREILDYFGEWRILRMARRRHRAETPVKIAFWDVLAQRR